MPDIILNGEVHHDSTHQDEYRVTASSSSARSSPRPGTPSEPSSHDREPPHKKRKLADSNPSLRNPPRPVSPPWKRSSAEGPTSFIEDGRRKSGRTNMVPLELQPQSTKRQTRAAFDKVVVDQQKHTRPTYNVSKTKVVPAAPTSTATATVNPQQNGTPEKKRGPGRPPKIRIPDTISNGKPESTPTVKTDSRPKLELSTPRTSEQPRKRTNSTGKSLRASGMEKKMKVEAVKVEDVRNPRDGASEMDATDNVSSRSPSPPLRIQKVTFRVHLPKLQIATPANIPPPKRYKSFEEFLIHDQTESAGPQEELTEQQIAKEAMIRWRVRSAQRTGGFLERRGMHNLPERQPEPRKQYAHRDHLLAHVNHFRTLLRAETRDHRRKAEALATEAKRYVEQKRLRNKVKTAEEVEWEQIVANHLKWRTVVKDMDKLWLAVQAEINVQRQKEYEEQQQAEIKGHLARVLDRTDQMLSKNLDRDDSAVNSDDNDSDGSSEDNISEDSEQMSETESASDTDEAPSDNDAEMTLDELKKKYDNIPDLPSESGVVREDMISATGRQSANPGSLHTDLDTDTDTEMDSEFDTDDDLDNDSDDSEGSGTDEASDNDRPGLLSLFSKSEISKMAPDIGLESTGNENREDSTTADEEMGNADVIETLPVDTNMDIEVQSNVSAIENNHESDPDHSTTPVLQSVDSMPMTTSIQPAHPLPHAKSIADMHASPEASSQPSPHTSITRESEPESASSVDLPAEDTNSIHHDNTKSSSTRTPVPQLLRGTLREYQHDGLDWLANLYSSGRSGILADEMGLGKTIQSISLLAHLAEVHEVWGPHLIVVPTSVILNWEMEFKKFLPGFKVLTYYGNLEERKAKRRGWMADDVFNVCITSYQLVLQDAKSFKRRRWHYMILDEAHNIKNFRSERWQTMMTFNTQARLLLTGTPLQNNLTELWSLLFFLHYGQENEGEDDAFAGLKEWSEWFKKPVESILEQGNQVLDQEDKEQVAKLHKVIRPFLLRRLKADVEKQMPLKYEHVEMCRLSKRQRQLYDGFMSRAQTKETLASGNYLSIINALMQLRKVCNHPDLFETRPINTSFAMPKPVVADYEIRDLLVRRRLLEGNFDRVDLNFLQLAPVYREDMSMMEFMETSRKHAYHQLKSLRDSQSRRTNRGAVWQGHDRSNVLQSLENVGRTTRLQELDRTMYFEAYRHHQHPVYGRALLEFLRFGTNYHRLSQNTINGPLLTSWGKQSPISALDLIQSVQQRSRNMHPFLEKFACITPAVIATDVNHLVVSRDVQHHVRQSFGAPSNDPFHTGRMKLSIAFPDKRLLQYDCGKLQRLDKLLRELQAGGHRALIFTQMTKVLDILEQFLNIHGHRYLRLDGATKIEQRQILTDRFNNDTRILAFILSSRSGGLGINLTGADTVIFYDLDWNPAMDRQCTDRAHRIGQTRDVHIYRFVSEHTIESNILRKANQKQLLDDVVIQEGDFTTEYMNRLSYKDMLDDNTDYNDAAGAAMDRVLGNDRNVAVLEQAEDKEDIAAAKVATKEVQNADDGDFDDKTAAATPHAEITATTGPYGATNTALAEADTPEEISHHIDEYMIRLQKYLVRNLPLGSSQGKGKSGRRKKKRDEHKVKRTR